ncbi:hypothetical protein KDL29_12680 [bacterium]|nr:hypothetical protein [bacterium]
MNEIPATRKSPSSIFQRLAGVPLDEFRVAWRLYTAENKRQLTRLLYFALTAIFLTMFLAPYLSLSGELGMLLQFLGLRDRVYDFSNPALDLQGVLPLLIPLTYRFVPGMAELPLPLGNRHIQVCRFVVLLLLILALSSCCGIAVYLFRHGQYFDSMIFELLGRLLLPLASILLSAAIAIPQMVIASLLDSDLRPTRRWKVTYAIWALAFLLSGSIFWWMPTDLSGDTFFNSFSPIMLVTAALPVLLMLALWRYRMQLLISYSVITIINIPLYFLLTGQAGDIYMKLKCVLNFYAAIGLLENMHFVYVDMIQ